MTTYRRGTFPLLKLRRWPRGPSSELAVHLYIGEDKRSVCGRTSGYGTSKAVGLSCLACWGRIVWIWLTVGLGPGPSEKC